MEITSLLSFIVLILCVRQRFKIMLKIMDCDFNITKQFLLKCNADFLKFMWLHRFLTISDHFFKMESDKFCKQMHFFCCAVKKITAGLRGFYFKNMNYYITLSAVSLGLILNAWLHHGWAAQIVLYVFMFLPIII